MCSVKSVRFQPLAFVYTCTSVGILGVHWYSVIGAFKSMGVLAAKEKSP